MSRKTQSAAIWAGLWLSALCGCATNGLPTESPAQPSAEPKPWHSGDFRGEVVRTPNYAIYSTVGDTAFNQRVAQVMEGSLQQYRSLAPVASSSQAPMECYVFANRREWAEFTRQRTGDDAAIYLKINRGGYTVEDVFVAYYIGDSGTFAVASHEGWHQFVSRHFKTRLPPFLEEGIATTFENITWSAAGQPRWNTTRNISRAQRLRTAIEQNSLWPLGELLGMHAGDVVSQPPERIEAFYAQNWAFARFLLDGDGGRYRPALQRMLSDAVAGRLYEQGSRSPRGDASFNPRAVRPMIEHYLGMSMPEIDSAYQLYIRTLAREEASQEWTN